jgi:hypothetical protein
MTTARLEFSQTRYTRTRPRLPLPPVQKTRVAAREAGVLCQVRVANLASGVCSKSSRRRSISQGIEPVVLRSRRARATARPGRKPWQPGSREPPANSRLALSGCSLLPPFPSYRPHPLLIACIPCLPPITITHALPPPIRKSQIHQLQQQARHHLPDLALAHHLLCPQGGALLLPDEVVRGRWYGVRFQRGPILPSLTGEC